MLGPVDALLGCRLRLPCRGDRRGGPDPARGQIRAACRCDLVPVRARLARKPTPLLGGLAILTGFIIAAAIWLPDAIHLKAPLRAAPDYFAVAHKWPLIGGAALITLIGAIDDIRELKPIVKLVGSDSRRLDCGPRRGNDQ